MVGNVTFWSIFWWLTLFVGCAVVGSLLYRCAYLASGEWRAKTIATSLAVVVSILLWIVSFAMFVSLLANVPPPS